jgi:hypothetical protein
MATAIQKNKKSYPVSQNLIETMHKEPSFNLVSTDH